MFGIFRKLRELLIKGEFVHLWQNNTSSPSDLLSLLDRFLDGKYNYPMEWDDFISWENENANFEGIRQRIGSHEALLFSGEKADMAKYKTYVLDERNRLAGVVGVPARQVPDEGEIA